MRIELPDHAAFQRAALVTVGVCGVVAAAGVLAGVSSATLAALELGAALAVLGPTALRGASPNGRFVRGAAVLAGLALAWQTRTSLGEGAAFSSLGPGIAEAGLGLVHGLVASVGLLGRHVEIRRLDAVEAAVSEARGELDTDAAELCDRALEARRRIGKALAGVRGPDPAQLEAMAKSVSLQVLALGRRCRSLMAEGDALRSVEIARRIDEIDRRREATTDPGARDEYGRARASLEEQRDRIETLHALAERVRARLHLDVAVLESTALAVAARAGAGVAGETAALVPVIERLRDVARDVDVETAAVTEASAEAG